MHETKPTPILQKIFSLRKTKKISLEKMGEALGVTRTTISNIENGNIALKVEDILKITAILEVEPWELFISDKDRLMRLTKEEEVLVLTFRKIKKEKMA